MRNKTINALFNMGMPANLRGFTYIVEAMCLFDEDSTYFNCKTMYLYYKIGQVCNTTASRVERGIRYAFESVLSNGNPEEVCKYLNTMRKTNSSLLSTLYLRLSQEDNCTVWY